MSVTGLGSDLPTILDGRYRLRAEVGTGGTARVVLADDLRLRRRVAIKLPLPALARDRSFLARFESEAQAAAAFSHPHVVAVYDWGNTDDGPYLVTEYLAGGSLAQMLEAGHVLSPSQVVKVGLEAASGLAAAHRRGMVHRDIKPGNLLFDEGGRLRIGDFGLVQALDHASLTDPTGLVLGTWRYAAPERARPGAVDGRTDVYSLAATLVEAATGERPGAGVDDPVELLTLRTFDDLSVPDSLGPAAEVIRRAGSAVLDERPSAEEFMRGLVAVTEQFGSPSPLPLVGPTVHRRFDVGAATQPVDDDATERVADATVLAPARLEGAAADPEPLPSRRFTEPSPRRWWWLFGAALVIAAAFAVSASFVSTTSTPVEEVVELGDLRGADIAEVRERAAANGWLLDEVQVRSDGFDRDTVIRQSPAPESRLTTGSAVVVDVVTGPLQSMVPYVVGLTEAAAVERLESRKFTVVAREPRFSEDVPAGVVMEATIDGDEITAGRLIEPETAFELVVSEGPIPRTVPSVVGVVFEDAQATVQAQGLVVTRADDVFSDTVPIGVVVSQDVPSGSTVARGSEVRLTVSKGPDLRTVPDVAGLSIDEATDALEAVGLVRSGVSGGGDIVESSSPGAGAQLRPGDSVELWAPL